MAWAQRTTEVGGRPAEQTIDKGFSSSAPVSELPRLAWFSVHARMSPGDGMVNPKEVDTLDAIEEDLVRLCDAFGRGSALYISRVVSPGLRQYYLYYGGNAELDNALPSLRSSYPKYQIDFEEKPDAAWAWYREMIANKPE
jgi:Family of unknown function (DUF695)